MATGRSFAEFVKNKCYNGLYQAAEDYVNSDWQSLNLYDLYHDDNGRMTKVFGHPGNAGFEGWKYD